MIVNSLIVVKIKNKKVLEVVVRKIRIRLFLVTLALICLGLVMIYSASAMVAYEHFGDSMYYLKRHLLYILVGIVFFVACLSVDYEKMRKYIKPFLLFSVLLLMAVFIPGIGHAAGGARRWIGIGHFSFQPSEIAKMAMVFYAADVLARKQSDTDSFFHSFMPLILVLSLSVMLILLEPDLGTAVTLAALVIIIAFVAEVRLKYLLFVLLPGLIGSGFLIALKPYRLKRIIAFMNPWSDRHGAGFQIVQSLIAMGSGGMFGVGLGNSKQKLFYLPEAHTDFIYSIICEELGILGSLGLLCLFVFFIWLGFKIAFLARNLFGRLLACGLVSMIALQVIINIGAVTGTIPPKGMPLPFISYGGTSLLYSMASVGLLLNISRHRR
ncbi:MAG: putative lipid II flippase FtsW [Candidatus Omnitrophota bacterium]